MVFRTPKEDEAFDESIIRINSSKNNKQNWVSIKDELDFTKIANIVKLSS